MRGHSATVTSVAYSPDSKTLLAGSDDKTATLWDAQTGTLLHTLRGQTDWIISVAFSPDGRTVLTGGADKTAILWDAQSGELLHTLSGHREAIWSVAYSPDGNTVLTGSLDGTAILWDAHTGALIRPLCPLLLPQVWAWVGVLLVVGPISVILVSQHNLLIRNALFSQRVI
jgi:WD40 repeat protein